MFKRKWSALPADPHFPSDLKELGYFVNEDDEVRSIENPDYYFKFFINRNQRWNERQRFAMNADALRSIIHARLESLGLQKTFLPLGVGVSPSPSNPHLPIYTSRALASKPRLVLLFGETTQDLGVLAHRVVSGRGGIDAGSMVSVARALLSPSSSSSSPGLILANTGELLWSAREGRTLSRAAFGSARMASAAHAGNLLPSEGECVPGNRDAAQHVRCVFEDVVARLAGPAATLDLVAVGDAADLVAEYLDHSAAWQRWGPRVKCFAIVGGMRAVQDVRCDGFRRFLRERARAYVPSPEPAGTPLSGADGNPRTATFTAHGCPVFSSGEPHHVECGLVAGREVVIDWLQEVADGGVAYRNPDFVVMYADPDGGGGDLPDPDWSRWEREYEKKKEEEEEEEKKKMEKMEKGSDDKFVVRVDTLSDSEDED
ncbi:Arb2 domain-containing protein [Biscogniauxia mediterranea]|nr:Arb2 domain-containing protein [Biscogniauxia mediterranea]